MEQYSSSAPVFIDRFPDKFFGDIWHPYSYVVES